MRPSLATEWTDGTDEPALLVSDIQTSALESLKGATLTESELDSLVIAKRKPLLGDWFFESDLGFIFAKRGAGKTWLGLHMARALAEGSACGPWQAHEKVKVLYIDSEMPLDEMRQRNQALRVAAGDNLSFLSHQVVFDRAERNLCLSEPLFQDAVTLLCEEQGYKVIFLDNQSTLITRVRENSADDWRDIIEGWLLGLRRRRIAVVILNHAGRNGEMRGTSKREDSAFWQIALDPTEKQGQGARFLSRFTKNRNAPEDPVPLNWHFQPEGDRVIPTWSEADPLQVLRGWVENGLTSCADIADEMGVSKGYVSKLAKRAETAGWLKIEKREYRIIGGQNDPSGRKRGDGVSFPHFRNSLPSCFPIYGGRKRETPLRFLFGFLPFPVSRPIHGKRETKRDFSWRTDCLPHACWIASPVSTRG